METQSTEPSYVNIQTYANLTSEQTQSEAENLQNISAVASPESRVSFVTQSARDAFAKLRMGGTQQLVIAENYALLSTLVKCQPAILQQDNTHLILTAAAKGFVKGAILLINKNPALWHSALVETTNHAQHESFVSLLAYAMDNDLLTNSGLTDKDVESLVCRLFERVSQQVEGDEESQRAIQKSFTELLQKQVPAALLLLRGTKAADENACLAVKAYVQSGLSRKLLNAEILPDRGRTLFHLIARHGDAQSLEWCLQCGANRWHKDFDGMHALAHALAAGNESTVGELTYRHPEHFALQDPEGNTIFHLLAKRQDSNESDVSNLSELCDFVEVQHGAGTLEVGPVNELRICAIEQCIKQCKEQRKEPSEEKHQHYDVLLMPNKEGKNCFEIAYESESAAVYFMLRKLDIFTDAALKRDQV